MKLVIAEKKSVATAIAQALCAAPVQRDGCYECGQLLVTWAQGHLIDLAMPEDYKDRDWRKWSLDTLPVDPSGHWQWKISAERGAGSRYRQIVRLIRRTDVDCLVNACDPDREGEAIFRRIADMEGSHKPELRLWVASLEAEAIQAAWRAMKPESEYQGLAWSAEIRSKADWLIGMNASRAYSLLYNARFSVGRVQTPTLAMIAERDRQIRNHKPVPFWTVIADAQEWGDCPRCGQPVRKTGRMWQCSTNKTEKTKDGKWATTAGCGWKMFARIAGKTITDQTARRLLAGQSVTLKGFTSKSGKKFDAAIRIDKERGTAFDFDR